MIKTERSEIRNSLPVTSRFSIGFFCHSIARSLSRGGVASWCYASEDVLHEAHYKLERWSVFHPLASAVDPVSKGNTLPLESLLQCMCIGSWEPEKRKSKISRPKIPAYDRCPSMTSFKIHVRSRS